MIASILCSFSRRMHLLAAAVGIFEGDRSGLLLVPCHRHDLGGPAAYALDGRPIESGLDGGALEHRGALKSPSFQVVTPHGQEFFEIWAG